MTVKIRRRRKNPTPHPQRRRQVDKSSVFLAPQLPDIKAGQIFENFIDRKQLAEKLSLSPSYISKLMFYEGLPHYKIGRAARYKLSEVMTFLQERKRP